MNLTLREVKSRARSLMLSRVKPAPLAVALVFAVISLALSFFLNRTGGSTVYIDNERMQEFSEQARAGNMPSYAEFCEAVQVETPKDDFFSSALTVAIRLVSILVSAGLSLYALRMTRGEVGELGNLLDGFSQFYRVIMVNLLRALAVGAGLLCFIIPGIRLFYGYRMAVYLLWDHPDWTPVQCLRFSRLMMNGRRRKLFTLDVSFLGWLFISSMPFSLAEFCLDQGMYGSLISTVFFGLAVTAFVSLYMEYTFSLWYNLCLGLTKDEKETEVKPPWES